VVSRADGARRGAPDARQVIDRYHLVKNLVEALEGFFLHKRAVLKAVHKQQQAEPKHTNPMVRSLPVMEADPPSQQGEAASLRRHRQAIELYEKIQEYVAKHVDVTAIAQHVGASRRTVYRYRQMTEPPPRKQIPSTRKKLIEAYQPYLVNRWNEGVRNSQQLWRELRERGGKVSAKTVSRFVGQLRKASGTARSFKQVAAARVYAWTGEQQRSLTARQAARLLVSREETLQEWQKEVRRLLAETNQEIATATRHVHSFLQMLRQLQGNHLDGWLNEVETHGIAELRSFAQGLRKEYRAVKAGLTEPWSNGPTEAHVQRLKLLKRQMYGQAGFPLLRQRVLNREEKLKTQPRKKKKEQPVAA
jgi:transposase